MTIHEKYYEIYGGRFFSFTSSIHHALQTVNPVAVVDFPVAQVVHDEAPDEAEYLPIAQLEHELETAVAYLPATQVVQEVDAVVPVVAYLPPTQAVQVVALPTLLYLPATQSEQLADKPEAY